MANSMSITKTLLKIRISSPSFRSITTLARNEDNEWEGEKEQFRKLKIPGVHEIEDARFKKKDFHKFESPPRYKKMKVDQDWTNVWPTAASFNWSVVPFPVRQGAVFNSHENKGIIPEKFGNIELMKIPNFLHLTPPHIKKQCAALKDLCTPWPSGLTKENYKDYLPVETITRDYCFSSNSIRDPRARAVTVKFKLSNIKFDYHGRDKFIRLCGERYNKETDEVTLTSDRCPLKTQNVDYIMYLIIVLYHESMTLEPWESEKTVDDMEKVFWEYSSSKKNLLTLLDKIYEFVNNILKECSQNDVQLADTLKKDVNKSEDDEKLPYLKQKPAEEEMMKVDEIQHYSENVLNLVNEDETKTNLDKYKNSVMGLLNIPKLMS